MNNSDKKRARLVGALFLIAMAASLVGATLVDGVLSNPDFLNNAAASSQQVTNAVLLEIVNGICVIGIAVILFPLLKKTNEALALGYVAFRIIEAMVIFAAIISPLAVIALSQEYLAAGAENASGFLAVGGSLIAVRTFLFDQLLGIFFSLAALILYYLLYQSRLVPRWLSIWGLLAVVSVFAWNLLEFVGIHVSFGMILALPIIVNEVVLAIWLIVKGFNRVETEFEHAEAVQSGV